MWSLIPQKGMPPTRLIRYCCSILKETSGKNRAITTGVRWDEGTKRKNSRGIYEGVHRNKDKRIILNNDNDDRRRWFERCELKAKTVINPIIDWTDEEVWDYIQSEKINTNPLYQCGFKRVGCIGCPMADKSRTFEFEKYPKYKQMYLHAFDRMLNSNLKKGKENRNGWKTAEDVFSWWLQEKPAKSQDSEKDE